MISIACYNYLGMQICRKLSAVTRCLVDCSRTIVVWSFELFLYYGVSKSYGQPWTKYSYLQVIGFVLLASGTFVYNRVLKLPAWLDGGAKPDVPSRALQAGWSPTVNRAAAFGWGPKFGFTSPHGPNSPGAFATPGAGPGADAEVEEFVFREVADADTAMCEQR